MISTPAGSSPAQLKGYAMKLGPFERRWGYEIHATERKMPNGTLGVCVATVHGCNTDDDDPDNWNNDEKLADATCTLLAASHHMLVALRHAERLAWLVCSEDIDGLRKVYDDERGDVWREINAAIVLATPTYYTESKTNEGDAQCKKK